MTVEVFTRGLGAVLSPGVELERLVSGFEFTEGPIWNSPGQYLIFSDVVGNCMYCWDDAEGISVFRKPSDMANGNSYDAHGRILTCHHATSSITRTDLDGTIAILASHYADRELNSPNDIVVKRDGSVYFSDPNFGRRPRVGVPRLQQQPFQAVYRLDPVTGALAPVATDFGNPNGLCFSLDEKHLFVNDSPRQHIRVFDVASDGSLSGGDVWAELSGDGPGVADGMKVDVQGNLYCCGPGGIYLFDANATPLGRIRLPEQTANLTWGGPDMMTLFITASTSLYRMRVTVPGRRSFD